MRSGVRDARLLDGSPWGNDFPERALVAADMETLDRAVDGVDAVVLLSDDGEQGTAKLPALMRRAASRAGVSKFVLIAESAESVDEAVAKADPVSVLRTAVPMPVLIGPFNDARVTGRLRVPYSLTRQLAYVDMEDVAEVVRLALYGRSSRSAQNDASLASTVGVDAHALARLMSTVIGRQITADQWPLDELLNGVEPGPFKDHVERLYTAYDPDGVTGDANALKDLLGREPRTLSAFLEELLSTSGPRPGTPARLEDRQPGSARRVDCDPFAGRERAVEHARASTGNRGLGSPR